jgi:P4 family phage/plasmid primase-like protien
MSEKLNHDDISLGARLAATYQHQLRCVAETGQWLHLENGIWSPSIQAPQYAAIDIVREAVTELENEPLRDGERRSARESRHEGAALGLQSHPKRQNVIKTAEPLLAISMAEFDADPWVLNTPSGVLDLRSGALTSAPHLCTKIAGARWEGVEASSQLWSDFLQTLTAGNADLAAYLQRAMGLAMLGEWREKAFWFAYGPPDAGKSVFLNVVAGVLGTYAAHASADTWLRRSNMGGPRDDLVRLRGARLVVTSEIKENTAFDAEVIKKVTGGDTITAAEKYANSITFTPQFCLWFAANDRPGIGVGDGGMWRRLQTIPCVNAVPAERQNPKLAATLISEHGSAILAWMWEGLQRYLEIGLSPCDVIQVENAAYLKATNSLADFADECLRITSNPLHRVGAAQMREAYVGWCKRNFIARPLGVKSFNLCLRKLGIYQGESKIEIDGQKVRAWRGVSLILGS